MDNKWWAYSIHGVHTLRNLFCMSNRILCDLFFRLLSNFRQFTSYILRFLQAFLCVSLVWVQKRSLKFVGVDLPYYHPLPYYHLLLTLRAKILPLGLYVKEANQRVQPGPHHALWHPDSHTNPRLSPSSSICGLPTPQLVCMCTVEHGWAGQRGRAGHRD